MSEDQEIKAGPKNIEEIDAHNDANSETADDFEFHLKAGQSIGSYTLVKQIGSGGMGVVWLATQDAMNRQVAIKFLLNEYNNQESEARFEREVKMISQLEHPHILPVYSYGKAFGISYIVMRYMPRGTVTDLVNERTLDLELALKIIEQSAGALDYAHSQNIIHRDVKPSNLFLDEGKYAYLADFGLAKMMSGEYDLTLTDDGISGTPDYMSPEQVRGLKLDARADIYSLGIIAFQLLTGKLPYVGKSPMETVMMQINASIPSVFLLVPKYPPEIDQVFNKVLAKAVSGRYETASEFANELRAVFQGQNTKVNLTDINTLSGQFVSQKTQMRQDKIEPAETKPSVRQPDRFEVPQQEAPQAVQSGRRLLISILGVASLLTFAFLIFLTWLIVFNPLRSVTAEPYGTVRAPADIVFDAAHNAIWVADKEESRIQRLTGNCHVNASNCGEVLSTIEVEAEPVRLFAGQDHILVRHQLSSFVSTIDIDNEAAELIQIKEIPINFVTVGENIWIITAGSELLEVQPDGHILFRIFAGDVLRSMVLLDGTLWIADEGLGVIKAFELESKRFNDERQVVVPQPQFIGLAADQENNTLYATLGKTDEVYAIDPATGNRLNLDIGTGQRPVDLWVVDDSLWVLNRESSNVQAFDRTSGRLVGTIELDGRPENGEMVICGPQCAELWIGFESGAPETLVRYNLTDNLDNIDRWSFLP